MPYKQAKMFVHRQKIVSKQKWNRWLDERKCPAFIPEQPDRVYREEGWSDWKNWFYWTGRCSCCTIDVLFRLAFALNMDDLTLVQL